MGQFPSLTESWEDFYDTEECIDATTKAMPALQFKAAYRNVVRSGNPGETRWPWDDPPILQTGSRF